MLFPLLSTNFGLDFTHCSIFVWLFCHECLAIRLNVIWFCVSWFFKLYLYVFSGNIWHNWIEFTENEKFRHALPFSTAYQKFWETFKTEIRFMEMKHAVEYMNIWMWLSKNGIFDFVRILWFQMSYQIAADERMYETMVPLWSFFFFLSLNCLLLHVQRIQIMQSEIVMSLHWFEIVFNAESPWRLNFNRKHKNWRKYRLIR